MTMGRPEQGSIFGFNGESYNATTGLQFLRARYYGVEFGRFLTSDTFLGSEEEPLSLNRYSYVSNDPVNNLDPSEHFAVMIGQGSNLNQAEWQRVHQRLITLGYQGVNNVALQVRPSPNQNTEQVIRIFRIRNGISPVTGRITRNDRTHLRLLSANATREVTPAPAPQTRVVTPPPTTNRFTKYTYKQYISSF